MYSNTGGSGNTAFGFEALREHFNANGNTAIGRFALSQSVHGNFNTALGLNSMSNNFNESDNVSIGPYALFDNDEGDSNVGIGDHSLYNNETGNQNTVVGAYAGFGQNGNNYSGNVFIGYSAGYNEINSNRLYIDNSSTASPLIYGEFDNNFLRINGAQELTGELNINKANVVLRAFGKEALWTDGNYFSGGLGSVYDYFHDDIKLGGGGTPAPIADLHIEDSGDASITLESTGAGQDAFIQFTDDASSASNHWTIRRDDSDAGKLPWRHNNFHKLTMTINGNMGIGPNTSSPAYVLFVDGTTGKPGGGSWTNSSDRRLKQDINDYSHGLDKVLSIKPVTFHYNELSGYDTNPEYVGVIAQELQKVAPYMVSESEKGYLDANNSAMMYMLINAVQEQQEMIDKQSKQIEALAAELSSLKIERAVAARK